MSWFGHESPFSAALSTPRSKTLVDNDRAGFVSYDYTGDLRLKLQTRAAAYGLAGLALAGAAIFSGSTLGLLNMGSAGVLSVLLTDPPSVPNGVTGVYVTYSSIAVHAIGPNDSGWVSFAGQGTIDTMRLINLSQTITSGTVPALTYNLVRLSISQVNVEYTGTNYTATVASGKLIVPIVGDVTVNSSSPAAALIDIQPAVLNLGNQTSPEFTIATGARALQVPSDDVSDSMGHVGNSYSLGGHDWFQTFKSHHSELNITGLFLGPNSFSISLSNSGSDDTTIRMIILTPLNQGQGEGEGEGTMMGSMASSIFFVIQSDGTLKLAGGTPNDIGPFLGSGGCTLAAGASHTFTFSGAIASSFGKSAISSGSTYNVVLMGSDATAFQAVNAS